MKKVITILVLAALSISCTKDEIENTAITSENISGGTWVQETSKVNGEDTEFDNSYTFKPDHQVFRTSKYGSVVDAGTYTLVNGELICEFTNPRIIHFRVMVKQINKTILKWEAHNSLGFLEESFTR